MTARGRVGVAVEAARVLAAWPALERALGREGPAPIVARLRRRAAGQPRRDARGRDQLRRAIAMVDARLPGRAGCYRRVLLEMALDAGAAAEPLCLGLHAQGGEIGHAWLAGAGDPPEGRAAFAVVVEI